MERADFDQWKAREVARLLALVESERRYYQELVAMLPVPLAVLSADGFVASANRAFRRLFKVSGEDLRRLSIEKILPAPELPAMIQEAQTGDVSPFVAATVVSGGERTLRIAVSAVRNWSDENSLETLLVVEDLGVAAPAAPAVPVLADLPAVVWSADAASLRFESVHGSAEELTGFPAEHWISHPEFFEERIYGEDRVRVLALYRAAIEASGERASEASAEFRAVASSGALVWVRESIRAAGPAVTGVLTDISRRKELERQILVSSRIEALQRLAGRMAHDLNNPLMIVQGYAEEMFQSLAEDDARRYDANEILKAAERMSSLTTQLIEFGRPQAPSAAALDLGVVLPALESRLAEAMGRNTTVELFAPDYALWAAADRAQLEETILTLAGTRAATPELTRMTVSWYSDVIAESVAGSTLLPRRYACITLRDNGRALEEAQREALFESPMAAGPGAALARAYATVRDWGGDLAVENGGPSGNTFAIYLPYLDAQPERAPEAATPVAEAPPPLPERLRETILVVDDEPGIRGLIRKILRREHYNVLEAGSADEALTVSLSHAGSIHLLLTDVIMPGLTGPELARRMCEASPDLKVLFISGYTGEESALPDQLPAGFAFLPKPFTLGALVSKVRETLDS